MRSRGIAPAFLLFVLAFLCTVVHADKLSAEGGHGVGITFPAPTDTTGVSQVKTVDFDPYRHRTDNRIRNDITVLLSDTVQQRIIASGDSTIQTTVDSLLNEVDLLEDNEFHFPDVHDFALIYNYFADSDTSYGQRARDDGSNVLFRLSSYPDLQRNHVDYYLPHWGVDLPYGWTKPGGTYPSTFWDEDEDSTSGPSPYYLNSVQAYDGPQGLNEGKCGWFRSGTASNLDFLHEYSHICGQSNFQPNSPPQWRWDGELLATAAEYLAGTHDPTSSWSPRFDFRYDGRVRQTEVHDSLASYHMKRLFATYLFQQFCEIDTVMTDDLVYKWVRWPGNEGKIQQWPGMNYLAKELELSPWKEMQVFAGDNSGIERLRTLVQNWHIAKLVNDSSLANGEYGFTPGNSAHTTTSGFLGTTTQLQ